METFTLTLSTGTFTFDGTTLVFTASDSTTTTFVNQSIIPTPTEPTAVITDTGVTITKSDGTSQDFVPVS